MGVKCLINIDNMTPLFLHNTLTGKKEKFNPAKKARIVKTTIGGMPTVTMYSCGPTVYDTSHIGNFRTAIMSDTVRRTLQYKGYRVKHAMNITDVDDKTIRRSAADHITLEELTTKYEDLFWKDMESLNILRPQQVMSARGHISHMIDMVSKLIKKGVAYVAEDGVYINVMKVKNYGELAHIKRSDLKEAALAQSRIANDEYDKKNPRDFAVWKFTTKENEAVDTAVHAIWDAPFGRGRPGWHIECSAMSIDALGETIDIHTGGTDLIFPHHTNEIAQSESVTGKTFVHYWIHGAFTNVNDEKMAKSKGNFIKIADLIEAKISPLSYRYLLLTSHYRTQINFSYEAVSAAQTAFINLCKHLITWHEAELAHLALNPNVASKKLTPEVKKYLELFDGFISDDFNMPKAIALLWKITKDTKLEPYQKRFLALEFDKVFGLRLDTITFTPSDTSKGEKGVNNTSNDVPPEITALAEARLAAREAKDFLQADALRQEIESRGYHVTDTEGGFDLTEL